MLPGKRFPTHILVFLAPAFIVYVVFMIYPLADLAAAQLVRARRGRGENVFVGFQNYVKLVTDANLAPRLWSAIRNNFVFFAMHMLFQESYRLAAGGVAERGRAG